MADEATLPERIQHLARRAVQIAYDQHRISLDYSPDSLEEVESILARLYEEKPKSLIDRLLGRGLTEQRLQTAAAI